MGDFKNIVICAQVPRLQREICMREYDPSVRNSSFSAMSIDLIGSFFLDTTIFFGLCLLA